MLQGQGQGHAPHQRQQAQAQRAGGPAAGAREKEASGVGGKVQRNANETEMQMAFKSAGCNSSAKLHSFVGFYLFLLTDRHAGASRIRELPIEITITRDPYYGE